MHSTTALQAWYDGRWERMRSKLGKFCVAVVNKLDNLNAKKCDVYSLKDFHVANDKSLSAPRVSLHAAWIHA